EVAIDSFENKSGAESRWLERAAPELLAATLAQRGDLTVISPWSAPGRPHPPLTGHTHLEGEVVGSPPALHLKVIAADARVLAETTTAPGDDLYRQVDSAAAEVRHALGAARASGVEASR